MNPIQHNPHGVQNNQGFENPQLYLISVKEQISLFIKQIFEDIQNNMAPNLNEVNQHIDRLFEFNYQNGH